MTGCLTKEDNNKKARVILSSSSSTTSSLSKSDSATQKLICHEFKKMEKKISKKLTKSVLETRKMIEENLSSQGKYKDMVVNVDLSLGMPTRDRKYEG